MPMDVWVLAGQSNMAGRGGVSRRPAAGGGGGGGGGLPGKAWDGVAAPAGAPAAPPGGPAVRSFGAVGWDVACEPLHAGLEPRPGKVAGVGPGLAFARALQASSDGGASAGLGLVPCACGETSVAEWSKGSAGGLFEAMVARTRAALAAAEAAEQSPGQAVLRGLLFYQGESDCGSEEAAKAWPARAAAVVEAFAAELAAEAPSRLAAVLVVPSPRPEAPNGRALCAHVASLRAAALAFDLSAAVSNADACWLDAEGLELAADQVHLTSAAQMRLGRQLAAATAGLLPEVSVLMPCRNAMPWLALAVASVMLQRSVRLELVAVDDSSKDGSGAFLEELAARIVAAGDGVGSEATDGDGDAAVRALEAAIARARACETPTSDWDAQHFADGAALTAVNIAAAWRRLRAQGLVHTRLVVRRIAAFGPSGQGRALNAALRAARAPLIGEMESDDIRPLHTFATLRDALRADQKLDGVVSRVQLCGWERQGMARYAEWQNSVLSHAQMDAGRWLEIPAMRASGLYRASALRCVLDGYRDLWEMDVAGADGELADGVASKRRRVVVDCALPEGSDPVAAACAAPLEGWWPVDSDFWHRWFAAGLRVRKVEQVLYLWRQYPAQSTRTHSRCSIERLRACKAHFLIAKLRQGGGGDGRAQLPAVECWGVGRSLDGWVEALAWLGVQATRVEYKPGAPLPKRNGKGDMGAQAQRAVRLMAYGMEKARRKVLNVVRDFDPACDFFVGS